MVVNVFLPMNLGKLKNFLGRKVENLNLIFYLADSVTLDPRLTK